MPKVSEHQQAGLRRIIRDAMAIDPLITMQGLCGVIEKKINRSVDPRFIKTLVKKVMGDIAVVADREKVEKRIQDLRESNRIIRDELMRMAFPSATMINPPSHTDRRKALEVIARMEVTQVKLEMDLGLFTRHLGQLDVEHRLKPLDDDVRSNIIEAFKNWGIKSPPTRKIDLGRVVMVKPTTIPNGEQTTKPSPEPATTKPNPAPIPTGLVVSQ